MLTGWAHVVGYHDQDLAYDFPACSYSAYDFPACSYSSNSGMIIQYMYLSPNSYTQCKIQLVSTGTDISPIVDDLMGKAASLRSAVRTAKATVEECGPSHVTYATRLLANTKCLNNVERDFMRSQSLPLARLI